MATPGWYPDPAGQPGAFRYWDGQGWGSETTATPYAAPAADALGGPTIPPGAPAAPPASPPSAPPSAPPVPTAAVPTYQSYESHPGASYPQQGYPQQGYPQQSWAPTPPTGPGSAKSGSGRTIGLVVLAVVVTLALGVATFFVVRPLVDDDEPASDSATDTSTSTPPSTDPTEEPSPEPTEPTEAPTEESEVDPAAPFSDDRTPTSRECTGGSPTQGSTAIARGKQTGGGLTLPKPKGFSDSGNLNQAAAFTYASGVSAPSKIIEAGWVAVHALGALPRANGFDSTGQAAADVLECMTLSPTFYRSFTSAKVTTSEAAEVDGHPAWVLDAVIRIDDPELKVEGDIAKVIVVDTGDLDSYGVFVSLVAIDHAGLIDQQQKLADELTVD